LVKINKLVKTPVRSAEFNFEATSLQTTSKLVHISKSPTNYTTPIIQSAIIQTRKKINPKSISNTKSI
jgi:hypothetical protein